jgi:hypothetical protein
MHIMEITGNTTKEKWTNFFNNQRNLVEFSFALRSTKKEYKFNISIGLLKSRDEKNNLL